MQLFQSCSNGSPKIFFSLSDGVLEVLKTTAHFAFNKPIGTPSPLSVSSKPYAIPGRITRSTQPFNIAGGCPHQFGCITIIPSEMEISSQYFFNV